MKRLVIPSIAALCAFAAPVANAQVLSEIRSDQAGADDNEFIEFAGAPGSTMTGLHLVIIGDGVDGSGVLEEVIALDGITFDDNGFAVIAENPFTAASCEEDPAITVCRSLNLENKDNVTYLIVSGFVGSLGLDVDTDDDGVIDPIDADGDEIIDGAPWATVVDRIAIIEAANPPPVGVEWHYGPPTVGPEDVGGVDEAPGHVYRCGDEWLLGEFDITAGADTPLAENPCPTSGPDAGPMAPDAGPGEPDAGPPPPGSPDAGFGVVPSPPLTPREQPGIICSASSTGAAGWLPFVMILALGFGSSRRRGRRVTRS